MDLITVITIALTIAALAVSVLAIYFEFKLHGSVSELRGITDTMRTLVVGIDRKLVDHVLAQQNSNTRNNLAPIINSIETQQDIDNFKKTFNTHFDEASKKATDKTKQEILLPIYLSSFGRESNVNRSSEENKES